MPWTMIMILARSNCCSTCAGPRLHRVFVHVSIRIWTRTTTSHSSSCRSIGSHFQIFAHAQWTCHVTITRGATIITTCKQCRLNDHDRPPTRSTSTSSKSELSKVENVKAVHTALNDAYRWALLSMQEVLQTPETSKLTFLKWLHLRLVGTVSVWRHELFTMAL